MAILVTCPNCAAKFQAAEKYAGRKASCPRCGEAIQVGGVANPSTVSSTATSGGDDWQGREAERTARLAEKQVRMRREDLPLSRFFMNVWSISVPLVIDSRIVAARDPASVVEQLKETRLAMYQGFEQSRSAVMELRFAQQMLLESRQRELHGEAPSAAGGSQGLTREEQAAEKAQSLLSEKTLHGAVAVLRRHMELAARRISLALSLGHRPEVITRLNQTNPLAGITEKLSALVVLGELSGELIGLNDYYTAIASLRQAAIPESSKPLADNLANQRCRELALQINAIVAKLGGCRSSNGSPRTLAQQLMAGAPKISNEATVLGCGRQLVECGTELYVDLLNDVAAAAEGIEIACGLGPIYRVGPAA